MPGQSENFPITPQQLPGLAAAHARPACAFQHRRRGGGVVVLEGDVGDAQLDSVGRWPTVCEFLCMSDQELARVDPVVMSLVVARGIPALACLDLGRYVGIADEWAGDLRDRMPQQEAEFRRTPEAWKNDLDFFRLGVVCWYVDVVLGIAYREEQRSRANIAYTDPNDLFLTGVMDSRRGTCGNMALLHVVLGRRIGLPVSLACVGSHLICRFDDGTKTINIESTDTGRGGFASPTDDELLVKYELPRKAQQCGSDLRSVTPREMLGLFLAARARHFENTHHLAEALRDYLLARHLFPRSRQLCIEQTNVSIVRSMQLFEPDETGHPTELGQRLRESFVVAPGTEKIVQRVEKPKENHNGNCVDTVLQEMFARGALP